MAKKSIPKKPEKRTVIGLRHHSKEWKVFEKRIKELNKGNTFSKYLNKKIHLLAEDYLECPDCILETLVNRETERKYYKIPKEVNKIFKEISKKSKVPLTAIIDRLIITPLLIEK